MATDLELFDQAWRLLRNCEPRRRNRCWFAMDHATWYTLLRSDHPLGQHAVHHSWGPGDADLLFGKPVTLTEDVAGLHLVVPDPNAESPPEPVPARPHPQTQAINEEFGWNDAQVVTFRPAS